MKPCRPIHGDFKSDCPVCARARRSERDARRMGEPWPPPEVPDGYVYRPPPPVPFRMGCINLGPVVEFCTSCGGKEERHVRACYHPDNQTEKCTFGVVSDLVWSCATCPNYAAETVG